MNRGVGVAFPPTTRVTILHMSCRRYRRGDANVECSSLLLYRVICMVWNTHDKDRGLNFVLREGEAEGEGFVGVLTSIDRRGSHIGSHGDGMCK